MNRLRVAILADYLEEGWPSMDLVADMLMDRLREEHGADIDPTLVRPRMRRRIAAVPGLGSVGAAVAADRVTNRLVDYARVAAKLADRHDVFHIVDHSYAHLVHRLPHARTLVTCHDLDTFRSVLQPEREPRSAPFRMMTRHILSGLCSAGHVACVTSATRDALIEQAGIPADRTSVVYNGPHPSCTPTPEPSADGPAGLLLGPRGATIDLLHVGSTIARKRIDVLLRVFAGVRVVYPNARLIRLGGPLTAEQRALARALGVAEGIVSLPFLDRPTVAAVYRRSALLLQPSEREGFGLPVIESLACGTPVVASDIDALREVAGAAAVYCPPDDVDAWVRAVIDLLTERAQRRDSWQARRNASVARASAFSWSRYTSEIVGLYRRLAGRPADVAAAVL
jgi:glycosyltransferase involved in cell wall biosynthesis